jgi:hypothetical protein
MQWSQEHMYDEMISSVWGRGCPADVGIGAGSTVKLENLKQQITNA